MAGRWLLALALIALSWAGCARAARPPRRYTTGWWQVGTQHIALSTDVPRETALEMAWAFEDTARALAHVLPTCPAFDREAIVVILFNDPADYQRITPAPGAGAFFHRVREGVSPFPSYVAMSHVRGQAQAFAHELTHRWVDACVPTLPLWMNEGLATTLETIRVHEDDIELGVPPFRFDADGPVHGVRRDGSRVLRVDRGTLPTARELASLSAADWHRGDDEEARTAGYAAAWALVHRLLIGGTDPERLAFRAYVEGLRSFDATRDEVFAEHLGAMDLDVALASYTNFSQRLHVAYSARSIGRPGARHLEPEEVHLLWGTLLAYAGEAVASARELAHVGASGRLAALLVQADLATVDERARIVADAVASTPGGDLRLTRAQAVVALERADREAATRALAGLERLRAPTARDLTLIAELSALLDDGATAMVFARQALTVDPSSFRARWVLGRALRAGHHLEEALPWLRSALALAEARAPAAVPGLEGELRAVACLQQMPPVEPSPADAPRSEAPVVLADSDVRALYESIGATIRGRDGDIQACYQSAVARGARDGRLDARLVVAPNGSVSQLDVCSSVGDDAFVACVREVLATLSFEPRDRRTVVTFPFVLGVR